METISFTATDAGLFANGGRDKLYGGVENDTIYGASVAYIKGNDGDDSLFGWVFDDEIRGDSGSDFIDGGGNQTGVQESLFGGSGNDWIFGGYGYQYINGDGDADRIFGEDHEDEIRGGLGNDEIHGGGGVDKLFGGGGRDKLHGDEDDDDVLDGGEGNDLINGGGGDDQGFSGGKGDDTLWSGDGAPDEPVIDMQGKGDADCDLEDGVPDPDCLVCENEIDVMPNGDTTSETAEFTTFDVLLSDQPTDIVTFSVASSNVSEGVLSVSSLTFTPSNWDTVQTFTVTGVNDGLPDGDQPYDVVFGTAVSTDPLYNGMTHSPISVLNIALPVVSVTATNASEVPMPPVTSTVGKFTISRSSSDISSALVVYYTVAGSATPGADYNVLPGTATIPAGEPSVDVVVVAVPDNLIEGTETVLMTLVRSPFYPDYEPVVPDPGAPYPGVLTISEPLYDLTFDVDDVIASEDVGNMIFTVTIAPPTGMTYLGTLTVSYNVTGDVGGDFTATSGTLTFSNFTGMQTATISVGIIDDTADESTEFLFMSFALASANPPIRSDAILMTLGVGQIVDNDDPVMPPMPVMPLMTFAPLLAPPTSPLLPGVTGLELFSATTSESSAAFDASEAGSDGGVSSGSDDGSLGSATFGVDVTAGGEAGLETTVLTADVDESATGAWIVTSEVTTTLMLEPDDSSDSSVAGQYPDSDGDNAETTTSGMVTDAPETMAQLGDELFALSSGGADVMEMLLLDSNASGLMESAPPGTDPSFGENAQLVVTADGGVAVGTLN